MKLIKDKFVGHKYEVISETKTHYTARNIKAKNLIFTINKSQAVILSK